MEMKKILIGGAVLVGGVLAISLVSNGNVKQSEPMGYLMGGGSYSGAPLETFTTSTSDVLPNVTNNYNMDTPDFTGLFPNERATPVVKKSSGSSSSGSTPVVLKTPTNTYNQKTGVAIIDGQGYSTAYNPNIVQASPNAFTKKAESMGVSSAYGSLDYKIPSDPNKKEKPIVTKKAYNPFTAVKNNLSQPMSTGVVSK
jgi:hypothetical protein